jgi:hypothetical protein
VRRILLLTFVGVVTSGMATGQEVTVELKPSEVFPNASGDSFVDIVLTSDRPVSGGTFVLTYDPQVVVGQPDVIGGPDSLVPMEIGNLYSRPCSVPAGKDAWQFRWSYGSNVLLPPGTHKPVTIRFPRLLRGPCSPLEFLDCGPTSNLIMFHEIQPVTPALSGGEACFMVPEMGGQFPGDCDRDAYVTISDAICLLGFLFSGTPLLLPCEDGLGSSEGNLTFLDFNGDADLDLADGVGLLQYLFSDGPPHVQGTDCRMMPGCPVFCTTG